MELDPDRRADAAARCREIERLAHDHDRQAAALRARIALLRRTWQLPAESLDTEGWRP